ncbi:hypothetical protein [Mycolicibacterium sp. P1-18]|nr:hypothetical protein [Mycolicibacterium sp. P1-18]
MTNPVSPVTIPDPVAVEMHVGPPQRVVVHAMQDDRPVDGF